MILESLVLHHFRNYENQAITFSPGINVIIGLNGQGKTNILEGIAYLSFGRSFRVNDDFYLIESGEEQASITGKFKQEKGSYDLRAIIKREGKLLRINSLVCTRLSQFVGKANVVLFSPSDLQYFEGAKQLRRRQLDMEIGKLDVSYLESLSRYHVILKQRNALLKNEIVDADMLGILTQQLIDIQIPLVIKRNAFVEELSPEVNKYYQQLTQSQDQITMNYQGIKGNNANDLAAELNDKYQNSYHRDQALRMTSYGVHRDDVNFSMNDHEVAHIASQGQKRLILLAYKMALLDYVYKKSGELPILCLDDIFSELDAEKIKTMFKWMNPRIQVFITTTEIAHMELERTFSLYTVTNGVIRREGDKSNGK